MSRFTTSCIVLFLLAVMATTAQGVTITHGSTTINMDFVSVGNTGNVADTEVMRDDGTTGYGSVDYSYNIGKYEVSENQWDAVSGASTTDLLDDPGNFSGNRPVTRISWHEMAMFCNWLTSGDVTDGAYTINSGGAVTGIDRNSVVSPHGLVYVIPTENEWYKAAYYDGGTSTYYDWPTGSDSVPDGIDYAGDTTFDAVFYDGYQESLPHAVDNAGILSPYGTMGQGGNVQEWTETASGSLLALRVLRGCSWQYFIPDYMSASRRRNYRATDETSDVGFRVASILIPETEPGDANRDGSVDVRDLGILAAYYDTGGGHGWEHADFTGDGFVDVADLGILSTNYGNGTTTTQVPEPNIITLLFCGIASLLYWRHNR